MGVGGSSEREAPSRPTCVLDPPSSLFPGLSAGSVSIPCNAGTLLQAEEFHSSVCLCESRESRDLKVCVGACVPNSTTHSSPKVAIDR